MRLWLASLFLWVGLVAPVRASEAAPRYSKREVRKALVAVVEAQLHAFRERDYVAAYRLAARPLRQRFSVEDFALMITRGYPLIARNTRADLGLPLDDGLRATMPVKVFDAEGRSAAYDYTFIKERDGWRIAGVLPQKPRRSDA